MKQIIRACSWVDEKAIPAIVGGCLGYAFGLAAQVVFIVLRMAR